MANAWNEFIRTSDTLSSHFADFFFFEYFILRGIFFQNRGNKHTFWRGEWGRISAPKTAEKNTGWGFVPNSFGLFPLTAILGHYTAYFKEVVWKKKFSLLQYTKIYKTTILKEMNQCITSVFRLTMSKVFNC